MPNNKISLEQVFSTADIQLVSDMAYALFPVDYGAYVPQEHIRDFLDEFQSPQALKDQISEGHAYFLIHHQQKLAGYIGIHPEKDQIELSKIYLNLDKRGQGLGKLVIAWLDDYTIDYGAKEVNLLVLENNLAAIRFYESHGFHKCGIFKKEFDSGNAEVNIKMKKEY